MNRYRTLASNTAIFAVGTFLSKVMSYLLIFLYTRVLTETEISDAEMLVQISNLIMPLAAVGVCDALMRFTIDAGDGRKEVFSSSIAILTGGSLAFLLVSPALLIFNVVSNYYFAVIIFVLCANLQMAVSFYIRSLKYTRLYALQGIINTALTILFNLLLLYVFKWGVTGFLLSVAFANFTVTLFLIVKMKLWQDVSLSHVRKSTVRALLVYGIPMIPTTLLWAGTNLTDHVIVRTFVDFGSDERINDGLFVCSYKIPNVLTLICTVFIEAWQISAVSDSKEGADREEFYENVFSGFGSVIFMAASALMMLSRHFMRVLVDPKFYGAWAFIPVLVIATVYNTFATFISSVYQVVKKSLPSFLTALVGASVNIGSSLFFVTVCGLGVQGVALGTVVSYIVLFSIRVVIARKFIKFSLHPLRIALNTVILSAQALLMVLGIPEGTFLGLPAWLWVQAAFLCAIILFNLRNIISGVKLILGRFSKKGASAE